MVYRPDYSNNLIKIHVGLGVESMKEFVVHKSTICKTSEFFQVACSDTWMSDQNTAIEVGKTHPKAFELYVHWTYSQKLDPSIISEKSKPFMPPLTIVKL